MVGNVVICVPAIDNSGPGKGAVALYDAFRGYYDVDIVVVYESGLRSKLVSRWTFLLSLFRKVRPSSVVISMCFSADLLCFLIQIVKRFRWVVSVRGDLEDNYKITYGLTFGRYLARIHYSMIGNATKCVAMHAVMKGQIMAHVPHADIEVIPNLLNEFELESARVRSTCSVGDSLLTVGYLGSLDGRKNLDLALYGLAEYLLSSSVRAVKFYIGGEGGDFARLRELVDQLNLTDVVEFLGFVSDPYCFLQGLDVYCHPSKSEGMSRSVMEALFFGVPVIANIALEGGELVQPGINGFYFDSPAELAHKLSAAQDLRFRSDRSRSLIPFHIQGESVLPKWKRLIDIELCPEIG